MKKSLLKFGSLFLLSLLVIAFIIPSSTILAQAESSDEEMVDIIVRYNNTVPDEEELDPSYKNVRSLDILPIQTMSVPDSAVKEISSQKNVKRVTFDQEMTTSETNRTLSEYDWNNDLIHSFDAWDEGYTGSGVSVAVIDTGFYPHSDITFAGGYSIFGGEDPWTNDTNGHGTHVAGVLAASQQSPARGIAPGVSLYGVKVYPSGKSGEDTPTSTSNLLLGLQWAINDANEGQGVDIINISSGYEEYNQDIYDAITEAVDAGILVVAASGNRQDGNNTIDYPAAHDEVVAVSSVDRNSVAASDSMSSEKNELAAPGVTIYGLSNSGGYENRSGTSQATPHVSGLAAIMMQRSKGSLTASQIRSQLQREALDRGAKGRDKNYGYGLVQYVSEDNSQGSDDSQTGNSGDESEDPSETDNDSEEEKPASNTPDDNAENENNDEDSEIENPSEEKADKDDEPEGSAETENPADNPDSSDEQEVDVSEKAVWIRPDINEKSAVLTNEDLESVADNGVLAVSFDYAMDDIEQLALSEDQIREIRERNISLLIARPDIEWLIPANNFQKGSGTVRFTKTLTSDPDQKDLAKSELYQFELLANDQPVHDFKEEMTYRFFSDLAEVDKDMLYHWNTDSEKWAEIGKLYSNGALVGKISQTGILGVFSPSAFDGTAKEEDVEKETEDKEAITATDTNSDSNESSDDQEQETEATQAGVSESSDTPSPLIVGGIVVLLSFGGGFYYFGGKSKP
ncbi:S8 family serine peptidase [Marinilactibacillus psychrotolerans]|uniref:S8 family peptidase n=1 Tax=Marinilactibacillus psychrotolerans TaxID=191770 RepID=UPI00388459EB